ncbi:hypothetical protein [Mesorhizobium sp. M0047]|uniref:hypothetical protein n=1 Tax=Mesorhizobium sp. M0047 TaxID=2956859 RepID=UPI003334B468
MPKLKGIYSVGQSDFDDLDLDEQPIAVSPNIEGAFVLKAKELDIDLQARLRDHAFVMKPKPHKIREAKQSCRSSPLLKPHHASYTSSLRHLSRSVMSTMKAFLQASSVHH